MLYIENAKKAFSSAASIMGIRNAETEFYHRFAEMIPDTIDIDTLILAFQVAFRDAYGKGERIDSFISLVPSYVRQFTTFEFAHEFRKKYNKEVLGLEQEELPDVNYGYREIEPDVIDISDKDMAEVLAALYNASTPIGFGFANYNPMSWTKEIAEIYIKKNAKPDFDGRIGFKYIFGRPVHCFFENDLVYVRAYNCENEEGLAQRAIATCPNVVKKRKL